MEKRFKVGDKVRIVGDFDNYYKYTGSSSKDIHTVDRIVDDRNPKYYYCVDGWWFPKEGYLEYAIIGGKIDGKKI